MNIRCPKCHHVIDVKPTGYECFEGRCRTCRLGVASVIQGGMLTTSLFRTEGRQRAHGCREEDVELPEIFHHWQEDDHEVPNHAR